MNLKSSDTSSGERSCFFFFELVKLQEINDVQTVISKMYPIIILCHHIHILQDKNVTEINCIQNALGSLINICQWLCNLNLDTKFEDIHSYQPNIQKQRILREIGLIEMIVKILYHLSEHGLLDNIKDRNYLLFNFEVVMVSFLKLSCLNNKANSCFVF